MDRQEQGSDGVGTETSLRVLAGATTVVIVLFAVIAAVQVRTSRNDAAVAEARAVNAEVAADVVSRMGEAVATTTAVAAGVVSSGTSAVPPVAPGIARLAFVPADPSRALVADLLIDGIDVVALRPWLDRARDAVDGPLIAAPVGDPPASTVIIALYDAVDGLSLAASSTATAVRRAELAGHVVAVVDLEAITAGIGSASWRLEDGPVVLRSSPEPPSGETVTIAVDVGQRRWQLVRAVDGPGLDGTAALAAALAVAGVILAVVLARQTGSALRRRADATERALARADTVATLAGVTRESTELGDILPGLAVQLEDALGLDGLALAVPSGDGDLHEIFAHGARADLHHATRLRENRTLLAGQTVVVPLHRAGRAIAVLRVVAGRPLSADEVDLLEIAAEMVTAAVVTARSIEQQQDAVARLQAVDELKTAFLGTASHELRTPVTAISGFAHVLVDRWADLGDPERRVFAERIASNARALEALVQDLLDFARIERGDHAMAVEILDLADVVTSVLDRLEPIWERHTIEATTEPDTSIRADRAALERIVTNLVSNAAKFAPEGSVVRVGVERRRDVAVLTVDDAGPGVPPAERDKIFARFFRGSSQAVVRTRGVGIGLSVVKDFVERMHGSISVDESPSGGARFIVTLPLVAATDASAGTVEEETDVPTT